MFVLGGLCAMMRGAVSRKFRGRQGPRLHDSVTSQLQMNEFKDDLKYLIRLEVM